MLPTTGQFVTERFEHDGGRQVTVYVPPDPATAVVFAGHGGWHVSRLAGALRAVTARSTMLVGVHGLPDDDGRLKEYVPGFDETRFAAHDCFFVEDVGRWARTRLGVALPAERTAVCGASLGGELALAMGASAPEDIRRGLLRAARRGLQAACGVRCHVCTSWPEPRSRSSTRMPRAGHLHWVVQVQMSS
jgi:pimeloyl-ACP methyl ester carboxylesterase